MSNTSKVDDLRVCHLDDLKVKNFDDLRVCHLDDLRVEIFYHLSSATLMTFESLLS